MSGASQRWWSQFLGAATLSADKKSLCQEYSLDSCPNRGDGRCLCLAMSDPRIQRILIVSVHKQVTVNIGGCISRIKVDLIPSGYIQPHPLIAPRRYTFQMFFRSCNVCHLWAACVGSLGLIKKGPNFLWDWLPAYFIGSPALISKIYWENIACHFTLQRWGVRIVDLNIPK